MRASKPLTMSFTEMYGSGEWIADLKDGKKSLIWTFILLFIQQTSIEYLEHLRCSAKSCVELEINRGLNFGCVLQKKRGDWMTMAIKLFKGSHFILIRTFFLVNLSTCEINNFKNKNLAWILYWNVFQYESWLLEWWIQLIHQRPPFKRRWQNP